MASRRTVLQTLALGTTAGMLAPETLLAQSAPKKDKLGVALVGLGYYSTDLLAPALQKTEHCYLAGIVTGTPAKAEKWKKQYNIPDKNVYNYQNFDQIANNPDIDVVYVVLPPSMHREYVVRAAKAGKHVWVEKPMAVTAKECQDMIDACKKAGVSLSVGYRLHHDPNTQAYVKFLRDGKLGKISMVNCSAAYYDGRTDHWKQKKEMGGGVMYDMGVYVLQGARLATGEEPIAVTAQQYTTRPDVYRNGLDETSMIQLEFPSGARAVLQTSYGINMNFMYVMGEKGILRVEPYSAYNGVKGNGPGGFAFDTPYPVPGQQTRQMDDDALAIKNKKPMLVPGEEGLRDIRIVEAVYEAARTGKRVKI
ncbi:gfo/Idh/MocA family oxidoreductase [Rudanella paleaurantiibacter]|uniref:Gfo/Idh/MocA family oxidoreductase n=1 Tax=Rudanella paleaurantiibacter TaxID=2614655 RepID=A0A7J5TY31_9BACT|nr:Gfo/Idh/MocA family oxidoreductase [Rudanella paleaurantiibacter]KAB7730056.1 gfo/Idh/MocA family oxidoreductase [Rudanella paleaurantiibacter]